MNKKASEKINAVSYILYLVIIAGGLTIILSSYVNTPVDVRNYESQILYDKLMNCFVKDGFLKDDVLKENFDVFTTCHVNKTVINSSRFYFNFNFYDEEGLKIRKDIFGGNPKEVDNIRNTCEIVFGKKTKSGLVCLFKNETYFYIDSSNVKTVKIVGWVTSDNQGVRNA